MWVAFGQMIANQSIHPHNTTTYSVDLFSLSVDNARAEIHKKMFTKNAFKIQLSEMRFLGKFWNEIKNSLIELKTNKKNISRFTSLA